MPTCSLVSWESSEGDGKSFDDEDLVSSLEKYTRELGKLCGGLEVQQLEAEDEDTMGVDANTDTLASLEEMSSECTALLACLEAGGYSPEEDDHQDMPMELDIDTDANEERHNQLQEPSHLEAACEEKLAHELDTFGDELKNLALCLGDIDIEEYDPQVSTTAFVDNEICQLVDHEHEARDEDNTTAKVIIVDEGGCGAKVKVSADETNTTHPKEELSLRTKNAVVSHVKRLALQKQRQLGDGNPFRVLTSAKILETDKEQLSVAGVKVKFQSTSFQKHIKRQIFARRIVQQTQEAQRLVERARLRGAVGASSKCNKDKLQKQLKPNATYLDQFTSASKHSSSSNEFDPRYLCAVYLYGLRRLGTTFITFSSLAQFEQRVRAKFAIEDVVSMYREVTETILPKPNARRGHHVKRLQRITSLGQVDDGDVICVTQNAYDDMTILCDWIKRRQRVVHGFQFEMRPPSTDASTFTEGVVPPPKLKPSGNNATKAQLWDSNGRTIGVKAQRDI